MIKKYGFLAYRNLKRRGLRSWLTMLGIFIGIAAVVSLISLGDGLQNAVTGQFSSLGTDKLIVTSVETGFGPPGSTAVTKLNEHDVDLIKQVNGVEEVIPRLLRGIAVQYNKVASFGFAVSMPEDSKQVGIIYETMNLKAQSGRLMNENDKGKVLLGNEYTKESMGFGKTIEIGNKINIQGKDFEVIGILEPASSFQVNLALMLLDSDLKDLLNIKDEYDLITIKLQKDADPVAVAEAITEKMRKDRGEKEGEEDFSVQTPVNAVQSVNTILNIINLIIAGIASISLIVGGIGISNTMYTSVLERTKEIGVMKAIGARNSDILLIFLFEAGMLGLAGGLIGCLIGLGLAFGLSFAANAALGTTLLKVTVSPMLVIGAIAFSLIVGIVSGVLPAIQASKLKPVDALRGV